LIDLAKIRIPDLFTLLRSYAGASDDDMLCALNMGVGMLFVLSPESVESAALRLSQIGYEAYEIGLVRPSETETRVSFQNSLIWGE
jgi:phosphoribosylaminoimidazole (AIR) synthetase